MRSSIAPVLAVAFFAAACADDPAVVPQPEKDAGKTDAPVVTDDAPSAVDVGVRVDAGGPPNDVADDRSTPIDRVEADAPAPPIDAPIVADAGAADAGVADAGVADIGVAPVDAPSPDAPPAVDAGTDAGVAADAQSPADGGAAPATGFAPTGTGWVVPEIGLTDGPYVTDSATGVRWWSLLDLDGDGRADLVQTGDPTRSGGYVFGAGTAAPTWRFYRNTGAGFATTAAAWSVPDIGLSDGPYTPSSATGVRWWSTFDLDGDGRPDLVQTGDPTRTGGYVFGAGTATPTWRYYRNTGTGFAATPTAWSVPDIGLTDGPYATASATGVRWWITLDLNADGRPDLVQTGDPTRTGGYVFGAGTATPSWRVFANTGTGFATTGAAWATPNIGLADGPYTAASATGTRWWTTLDATGDHRPDLVQTGDPARTGGYVFGAGTASPSWRVFANTGTGFAAAAGAWATPDIGLADGPYATAAATGVRWWSTLDLNGDGRIDLAQTGDPTRTGGYVFAGTPRTWRVFLGR
jgi:hypothetical protein